MADQQIVRTGGSRAVQGCLVGAVLLFVLLLVAMIVLGYQQFRENTGEPVSFDTPAIAPTSGLAEAKVGGRTTTPPADPTLATIDG